MVEDSKKIERVQKCAFYVILGDGYGSCESSLHKLHIDIIKVREAAI